MQITRALKIRDAARMAVADIFSSAARFGLPHDVMLQRRNEAYERHGVAKAPRWVSAFLDGYWNARQEQAYRDSLVYGAIIDGRFYSTHSNRTDYYEKNGIAPSAFAQDNPTKGHYWADSLKPFFTSPN